MTQAERTDAALLLTEAVTDALGFVSGVTLVASVYDPKAPTNKWLNMTTGAWQAAPDTAVMTEGATGRFSVEVDLSSTATGSTHLQAFFEPTAGPYLQSSERTILLRNTVYDVADKADQDLILQDTAAMQPLIDVAVSTRSSHAAPDLSALALEATLAATDGTVNAILTDTADMQPKVAAGVSAWVTAVGFATPGDAMTLAANAVDAAALATDAVTEIRNSILSDGTPFAGADIAAILADTATTIPAMLTAIQGATFDTLTDSLEAIRNQGDAAWVTGAGSSATATAQAVWNAVASVYNQAGSMGELLNGAGGAFTPAQVAVAVWTEALTPHLGADQAAQYLADILTDTADVQPRVVAVETDTAAMQPTIAGNLDAPVSTRAVPGDGMVASSIAADAVNATALATDAVNEIAAKIASDLVAAHGAGSYLSATGFAVPGAAMTLTTAEKVALVDDVWNELQSGHVAPGTFGKFIDTEISTSGGGATPAAIAAEVETVLSAAHGVGAWISAVVAGLATSAEVAGVDGKVDTVITTGGTGPWTQGGTATIDPQGVRDAMLLAATGGAPSIDGKLDSNAAAIALTATQASVDVIDAIVDAIKVSTDAGASGPWTTGAGGDPAVYAAAVWGAFKAAYNDPNTFGEVINGLDLGSLDTDGIIDAINAAVSLVIAAIDKSVPKITNTILPNLYAGQKGTALLSPVYRNGTLMTDSELAGATQLSMEINNITTVQQYDITVGVSVGPTGHILYTTRAGDSIFETAGKWEYQASGLTAQGAPFVSQRLTVRVYNPVA